MKGKLLCLLIAILILAIAFSGCVEENKKEAVKLSIQQLIDNASPGDTINIPDGTYYENIIINKTINLIGKDRNNTIINGSGYGNILNISANYVQITGFTIKSNGSYACGIYISSNFNIITNNNIIKNMYGIRLKSSSQNIVSNNIIINNAYPLEFYSSSNNNTISDNTITKNYGNGIGFYSCNNNTVFSNIITDNPFRGIYLENSQNNFISNNTISNNNGGIDLINSRSHTISGNAITNNKGDGIWLYDSTSNTINDNTIKNNNNRGIYFLDSNNNIINVNNIDNNKEDGISFWNSSSNKIFHNNLINNIPNADTHIEGNNIWYNTTLELGNYWSDYTGLDNDNNGVGDTPYTIEGEDNQDLYPLINPVYI